MTIKSDFQLRQEGSDRWIAALRLLDDAKKIQQATRTLPFAERLAAMKKVVALEAEALSNSLEMLRLEAEPIVSQCAEIRWQNLMYLVL